VTPPSERREAEGAAGPLSGVRVLDLTRGMPGALTTMVLADYGAEVVMVENPAGAPLRRTHGHSIWNRGKRSVAADIHHADGRRVVQDLARSADIVVEDHRPGDLATRSLAYEDVAAGNPDVVYCSITGYGQDGSRRDRLGFDAAVAAHLGIMNEWGGTREGPIFLGHPGIDYSTAFIALISTLAGLRARVVSGDGEHMDVSLLDGALAMYTMNWWMERKAGSIDEKTSTGDLRFGHKRLLLRMFECEGDELIQVHTGAAGAFDRAMEVFGLGDEVSKMEGAVQMSSLLTDRDLEILSTRLPDIMRSRPRREWLEALWANQVAARPVGRPGEALDDDQVRHAGIVATLDDPDLGRIEVVGPTVLMADSPGAISGPAPGLDADGDELRATGWRSEGLAPATEPRSLRFPLEGVRIADFGTFFAAPYASRLLSDLGADVVKVEGIDGDPMRPLPEMFNGANHGKLGVAANLKHPAAAKFARDLIASADIVQHNLRPGAAERLGIDAVSARALRPDLIYHYAPGYGSSGPKSMLQSFAPLLSGFVGTFRIGAGEGNRPHGTFGNEDYYNGLLGGCAALLALVHRERTGRGQYVESPQLHSSLFTTSEYYKRDGRYESVIPRLDSQLYGWGAGYRIYQCLDAWICVTCVRDEQVAALVKVVVPDDEAANLSPDDLTATAPSIGPAAELLGDHFVEALAEDWVERLAAAGVPAEAVCDTSWMSGELWEDEEMKRTGHVEWVDHPDHGPVRAIAQFFHPLRHSTPPRERTPLHGEHTTVVLESLGYSPDEIDDLLAQGAMRAAEGRTPKIDA
jgi:crotonobetainyl-CoA:carnitine CoA-transferase CaiB-like acyl-CoA transferase